MAEIAATNVTVTWHAKDDKVKCEHLLCVFPTFTFGNGALTYPATGVPLPAMGKYGLKAIKTAYIEGMPGNGYFYKYDKTNHSVRIWEGDYDAGADGPFGEVTGAHAPAATTLTITFWGR